MTDSTLRETPKTGEPQTEVDIANEDAEDEDAEDEEGDEDIRRVSGCTCEVPYAYDGSDSNEGRPIERQYHELCCALLPDFTGWLRYTGDDETRAYVNPKNLEEAYVQVNPDGVGKYFYLVRAEVTT